MYFLYFFKELDEEQGDIHTMIAGVFRRLDDRRYSCHSFEKDKEIEVIQKLSERVLGEKSILLESADSLAELDW